MYIIQADTASLKSMHIFFSTFRLYTCSRSLGAVSLWSDPSSAIHQLRPVLEMTITHLPISQQSREAV